MHNKQKFLDGEKLFIRYCSMGNAGTWALLNEYARQEMPNPRTGRVSPMGPKWAAWRWAFRNPEESYKYWQPFAHEKDPASDTSFEAYLQVLMHKANKNPDIASKLQVMRLCKKYGLPVDYDVEPRHVVQVTDKSHPMFQSLLIVDEVHGETLKGYCIVPDTVYPERNGRETISLEIDSSAVGVIGKRIV